MLTFEILQSVVCDETQVQNYSSDLSDNGEASKYKWLWLLSSIMGINRKATSSYASFDAETPAVY